MVPRIPVRPSKYGAKRTEIDGIAFASQKEGRRYQELKLLAQAGEIHRLRLQHPLVLTVPAKDAPAGYPMQKIGTYIADFVYCTCRRKEKCEGTMGVVEDVKGFKTPLYRWKKRHAEIQYGITIREL